MYKKNNKLPKVSELLNRALAKAQRFHEELCPLID
jgi:hypothetical protein